MNNFASVVPNLQKGSFLSGAGGKVLGKIGGKLIGKIGGKVVGGVIKAIPVVGNIASIITSIIPKEVYQNTFAAVFKNGFNLKCWGASWNPKKAEGVMASVLPTLQQSAAELMKLPMAQYAGAVNAWIAQFYETNKVERSWLNSTAKDCTKKGLEVLIGGLDNFFMEVLPAFKDHAKANGHTLKMDRVVNMVLEEHKGTSVEMEVYRLEGGGKLKATEFTAKSTKFVDQAVLNEETGEIEIISVPKKENNNMIVMAGLAALAFFVIKK